MGGGRGAGRPNRAGKFPRVSSMSGTSEQTLGRFAERVIDGIVLKCRGRGGGVW